MALGTGGRKTAKKEKFVIHYAEHGEGIEAYRYAYPKAKCNNSTASKRAWELLNKDDYVMTRLSEIHAKAVERAEVSIERTLREAARIAFADIRKVFNEDGTLKKISELDDDTAAALAGFDATTVFGGDEPIDVRKVRLWSKVDALEKLFKHLGMFKADNNSQRERLVILKDFTGA